MRRPKIWRVLLAGAVIGLVEAAGLDGTRRHRRRPVRVVWLDDRDPADLLAGAGVWFLDPLPDPRPEPGDLRRPAPRGIRLTTLDGRRLAGRLRPRSS